MKQVRRLLVIPVFLCLSAFFAGCGNDGPPSTPTSPEERIKAIESNPDFTAEQKERYKQQVAETEKQRQMAMQFQKNMQQPSANSSAR